MSNKILIDAALDKLAAFAQNYSKLDKNRFEK